MKEFVTSKNEKLYISVKNRIPIKFNKIQSDSLWTSSIRDGIAIIEYCESKHCVEAFTHELLHIYIQLAVCRTFFQKVKT